MFKSIAKDILPHVKKVSIVVTGDDEKCSVVLITEAKDNGISVNPITLRGTAQQVEDGFKDAIKSVFTENEQLFSNYKEVAKEVKASATKSSTSTTKSDVKKEEPKKEEPKPKSYTKEQKAAIAKADEIVEKARKTDDPDMVNYFQKEYTKKLEAVKCDADDIKAFTDKLDKIRKDKGFTDEAEETTEENAEETDDNTEESDDSKGDDLFSGTKEKKSTTPAKPAAKATATATAEKKPAAKAAAKQAEAEDEDDDIF